MWVRAMHGDRDLLDRLMRVLRIDAAKMVRGWPNAVRKAGDAETVVQEACLWFLRDFDPDKGAPKAFMARCVRGVANGYVRKRKGAEADEGIEDYAPPSTEAMDWPRLLEVLPYLSEVELRAVAVLIDFDGWQDGARRLGVSRQALHKGFRQVAAVMELRDRAGVDAVAQARKRSSSPSCVALRARITVAVMEAAG